MFSLGFGEILVIAIIALIFIGPDQLPEIARVCARLLNEWKRAASDLTSPINNFKDDMINKIGENRMRDEEESPPKDPPAGGDPV